MESSFKAFSISFKHSGTFQEVSIMRLRSSLFIIYRFLDEVRMALLVRVTLYKFGASVFIGKLLRCTKMV